MLKRKRKLSKDSKAVIALMEIIDSCPIENPTTAELALYLIQSCRVLVV